MALSVGSKTKRPARTDLFWAVERVDRYRLCAALVQAAGRVVIVCRTQADAARVAGELSRHGVPAASVEHRDFSAPQVRAQVVTDETALSCVRNGASCVIQFDPATTARRHKRRVELLATSRAVVVTLVVPERVVEARLLLADLGLPDVIGGVDLAVARRALLIAQNTEPAASAVDTADIAGPGDHGSGVRVVVGRAAERARSVVGAAVRTVRDRLPRMGVPLPASAGADQPAVHRDQRAS